MREKPTLGSLFSGIGGLDLGLERAGFDVRWQVEKDPYCSKVLAKHWPDVARYEDVRDVGARSLSAVDLIAGGFPCQDISYAGPGIGLHGERSSLWFEFARIIREMGPRFVLVENVAALLDRGIGDVLGTLADIGYDAEWTILSACAVGAPHARERLFLLAYPNGHASPLGICTRHGPPKASGGTAPAIRKGVRPFAQVGAAPVGGVRGHWQELPEPALPRMADGLPHELDAIRALGNAVVPQVAEWIGSRLIQALGDRAA